MNISFMNEDQSFKHPHNIDDLDNLPVSMDKEEQALIEQTLKDGRSYMFTFKVYSGGPINTILIQPNQQDALLPD